MRATTAATPKAAGIPAIHHHSADPEGTESATDSTQPTPNHHANPR
jgi:hypothetical protein